MARPSARAPLEPFAYRDFRRYLADWQTVRALDRLPDSVGWLAKRLNLTAARLGNILSRGERWPDERAARLCAALGLTGEALAFYRLLITFNTAADLDERQQALEAAVDILAERAERAGQGGVHRARMGWPHAVVQHLMDWPGYQPDPHWIAAQVGDGCTPAQAAQALLDLAHPNSASAVPDQITLRPDSDLVDVLAMDLALRRTQARLAADPGAVWRRMGFWALPRGAGASVAGVAELRPSYTARRPGVPAEVVTAVLPAALPLNRPMTRRAPPRRDLT